ncbi:MULTISPECIES: GNAT family N-acetyltransferase [unclassified Luteococcus]|uniref:GNAT family N-acetyltransferase n=1 Tax=unclassified Luteococcus TaxID=2639923 RepID=UPI00313ADFBA
MAEDSVGRMVGLGKVAPETAWAQDEVRIRAAGAQAEIGWLIAPDQQGRGLGTELAAALLEIAFDADYRRVTAYCFAANEPSWRIMERIGMRREGTFRQDSLHRSGEWLDSYAYALLASER